jgi:two-component system, NarL family, response regulator LiaR
MRAARELTQTERHVARLAARGLQNEEIADELGLSVETVELQLEGMFRRLGLESDPLFAPFRRVRLGAGAR